MKRFFIALAAMAAMVGCSKENTPSEVITVDNFTVDAKIVVDDTRVTVEGEKFTDVKWELNDKVTLVSEAGAKATLSATEAGDVVRFRGEGEYAADVDTYYAIYPNVDIVDYVASINLAEQSGDDAAVLAAASYSVPKGVIDMAFTPQNALLHVSVTNGVSLAKAEFKAFDGSMLPATYIYNFKQGKPSASGEVEKYVIENPSNSFFFALPADLELADGYMIYLTDSNGNICSKAYNGKTFTKATTTRVDIEFAAPKVTLGEPMTSYSYYLKGNPTEANKCENNVIYFPTATTISNLQNAMIADYGFIVDGVTYDKEKVSYNKTTKSFNMTQNYAVSSWGAKNIEAYVVTKDGKRYSASTTVHITGLPYTLNVTANDGNWSEDTDYSLGLDWLAKCFFWGESGAIKIGDGATSSNLWIENKNFKLPENVNVNIYSSGAVRAAALGTKNTLTISVSGTSKFSKTVKGETWNAVKEDYTCDVKQCAMTQASPSVRVNSSYNLSGTYVEVKSLKITYGNK